MDSVALPNVHWLSRDASGTRVAITSGMGHWLVMARFNPATGTLAFDERFGTRDDGTPGRLVTDREGRAMMPHGVAWGP